MHTLFAAPAYAKFLDDIADTQRDEWATHNGSVPEVCPNYGHGANPPDPAFGAGYAVLVWNQFRYYGDTVALTTHYAGIKAFAETLIARAGGSGCTAGVLDVSTSTHGDWVSVANDSVGATTCSGRAALDHHANATCCLFMECPDAVVAGYHFILQLRIVAAAAVVLGYTVDAHRFATLAHDASASLAVAEYRGGSKQMGYGYQADQALALALGSPGGVVPPADVAAVAAGLAADVARRGGHLNTGVFGTKALLPALSSAGYGDAALGVLTQTTPPGWGSWVANNDATTLFEMWGAFDQVPPASGTASRNHVMFSTFVPWLYQTIAGVAMDEGAFGVGALPPPPLLQEGTAEGASAGNGAAGAATVYPTGYSSFRVAPLLPLGLTSASATVVTMRGRIKVSWAVDETAGAAAAVPTVWLNVSLPVGADTPVTVPLPPRAARQNQACSASSVIVRESGTVVWSRGVFAKGASSGVVAGASVQGRRQQPGVVFTVGSGHYLFTVACGAAGLLDGI